MPPLNEARSARFPRNGLLAVYADNPFSGR